MTNQFEMCEEMKVICEYNGSELRSDENADYYLFEYKDKLIICDYDGAKNRTYIPLVGPPHHNPKRREEIGRQCAFWKAIKSHIRDKKDNPECILPKPSPFV